MQSDFQDWSELNKQANQILEKKILGLDVILKWVVKPAFDDHFRIDLVKNRNETYQLEKLIWKKKYDSNKLNDPLEKIKLFGHYAPTFERSSIMLSQKSHTHLLHIIESLIKNEDETKVVDKPIVLDGVSHEMWIHYLGKEISLEWNLPSKQWKTIPLLSQFLLELSGSNQDDK